MFVRKVKNRSGSFSVQIISKVTGKYRVIKTIGSGRSDQELEFLMQRAQQELRQISGAGSLFIQKQDTFIESYLSSLSNGQVQVIGPELIFGTIFNAIGFDKVNEGIFRHLVIARLYQPGSKLKTIDYLQRFLGVNKDVSEIYRFLDKLREQIKEQIEQIAFTHTKRVLGGEISIVFYDMTTLHFEASDEDDLRRTGFSKEGRHQNPQIYLGLLVGLQGFAIGYDIYEGNIFEGHTLIPFLEKFERRFNLNKPVVVADAGLLTNRNIEMLEANEYKYIIGARIKNEPDKIKSKILEEQWHDGKTITIAKSKKVKLIVSYSQKRSHKDQHSRKRGLQRLEKSLKSGKLSKGNINNKGYNKYLKMIGELHIEIDYQKFENDKVWDGLKGYVTNTSLKPKQVIENYSNLWQIEKAFRISKTDLKIRPIYHRLRHRIEGHICIAFAAYAVYKELERVLAKEQSPITLKRAADLTHNIYQIKIILPESLNQKTILLNMNAEQSALYQIILKNFRVLH
jgi:transposase